MKKSLKISSLILFASVVACSTVTDSANYKEAKKKSEQEIKARSQINYEVIELENPGGNTFGLSINDNLEVAGYGKSTKFIQFPLEWINTQAVELGGFDPSFPFGEAEGINSDNVVVGRSTLTNGAIHAFIWSERAGMQDLGTLPNGKQSQAYAINEKNEVVGWSFANGYQDQRAFFWSDRKKMMSLGTLGGSKSAAYSINDHSMVTGNSTISSGNMHAFIWDPKYGMSDLGTLGGRFSVATDINNNDQIVGWSETTRGDIEAYIWDRKNGMKSLGKYFKRYGRPYAINDHGVIVGEYLSSANIIHAFTLDLNTGLFTDLGNINGPNGNRSFARDINSNGDVTGYIFLQSSNTNSAVIWKK